MLCCFSLEYEQQDILICAYLHMRPKLSEAVSAAVRSMEDGGGGPWENEEMLARGRPTGLPSRNLSRKPISGQIVRQTYSEEAAGMAAWRMFTFVIAVIAVEPSFASAAAAAARARGILEWVRHCPNYILSCFAAESEWSVGFLGQSCD